MTEKKFTKGPWGNDKTIKVRGLNFLSHCHYEDEVARHNAHLIAAAPDLYEALSDLISSLKIVGYDGLQAEFDNCARALTKARGETP